MSRVTANFAIDTFTLTYTAGAERLDHRHHAADRELRREWHRSHRGAGNRAITLSTGATHRPLPRTDTNVTANISVTANFAINTYTLTYTAGANGSITGTTPQTVNYDASGTAVTAVPATGYHFCQLERRLNRQSKNRRQRHRKYLRYGQFCRRHLHGFGRLGITGATVAFSGTTSGSAIVSGSSYSFTVPYGWTGTITPTKAGYTFAPPSINVNPGVTANLPGQDFTPTINTYTVSGTLGTTGAAVAFSGTTSGSATVSGSSYSFSVPYGWTGTITPTKTGYTFSPPPSRVTTGCDR